MSVLQNIIHDEIEATPASTITREHNQSGLVVRYATDQASRNRSSFAAPIVELTGEPTIPSDPTHKVAHDTVRGVLHQYHHKSKVSIIRKGRVKIRIEDNFDPPDQSSIGKKLYATEGGKCRDGGIDSVTAKTSAAKGEIVQYVNDTGTPEWFSLGNLTNLPGVTALSAAIDVVASDTAAGTAVQHKVVILDRNIAAATHTNLPGSQAYSKGDVFQGVGTTAAWTYRGNIFSLTSRSIGDVVGVSAASTFNSLSPDVGDIVIFESAVGAGITAFPPGHAGSDEDTAFGEIVGYSTVDIPGEGDVIFYIADINFPES